MDATDISSYYRARARLQNTDVQEDKIELRYPFPDKFAKPLDPIYKPIFSDKVKYRLFWVAIIIIFITILQFRKGIFFL